MAEGPIGKRLPHQPTARVVLTLSVMFTTARSTTTTRPPACRGDRTLCPAPVRRRVRGAGVVTTRRCVAYHSIEHQTRCRWCGGLRRPDGCDVRQRSAPELPPQPEGDSGFAPRRLSALACRGRGAGARRWRPMAARRYGMRRNALYAIGSARRAARGWWSGRRRRRVRDAAAGLPQRLGQDRS
jgi:hypothetical protein